MNKRAQNIEEMNEILSRFATEEGFEKALHFKPQPSDVIVTPFAKCGTTWMQQIVHGLRSGGDMNFPEISAVTPWIELAHDMGMDVDAPQDGPFRIFKSHLGWDLVPKGARYIVVLRDPVDAMLSLYRFFDGWFIERGAISLDAFAVYFLDRAEERNYWIHACSWWAVRDRDDVLLLAYEHMKRDLPGSVDRVADFLGLTDAALRALVTRQATLEFMKAHGDQFDDHLTREARDGPCGLPPGSEVTKVDRGQSGLGKPMASQDVLAAFEQKWSETLEAQFGLKSYSAVLDQLA